jgi:flavin-dependent dehydrogenase
VVVCGDAGGFVNAYTGEGIYYAMVTGELAALAATRAVAPAADPVEALGEYETRWRAEIGLELEDSVRIQRRLFGDSRLADWIIRAAASDRHLCRLFARVALGEADPRAHRFELAWRFLRAALRGRVPLAALRPR